MSDERVETIKRAYALEQIEKPLATKAGDIPSSYEAITAEWLTAILCKDHLGAVVTSFQLGPRDSGSSNRRRIHLQYNSAGQQAGLPASVFCKASQELNNRILCSSGMTHSEVTFFNKIRPRIEIEAPTSYLAVYDPVSYKSIIVLKDIGDEVTFCSHTTPVDQLRVKSQLDLLAKLHGRFYKSRDFEGDLSDVLTFHWRFNNLVNKHRFAEACDNGFVAARDVIPEPLFKRRPEVWPATMLAVERHAILPPTLSHGDVHLKNWYITKDGRMGLADWQVTCRAHWSRDLAYTISTALKIGDRRKWEKELVQYYLKQLAANGGPAEDFEDAWLNYRQQMLTVLAWWTVTLKPGDEMPDMQPQDTTIEFMTRIAQAMEDLGTLDSFG